MEQNHVIEVTGVEGRKDQLLIRVFTPQNPNGGTDLVNLSVKYAQKENSLAKSISRLLNTGIAKIEKGSATTDDGINILVIRFTFKHEVQLADDDVYRRVVAVVNHPAYQWLVELTREIKEPTGESGLIERNETTV